MHEEGRPCGRPSRFNESCPGLRSQLADPRRPVRERASPTGAMSGAATRPEQVVTGAAEEERAAPVGVVARVSDVLARDPDGIAVYCRGSVVTPARADGVGEPLLSVAG